MAGYLRSLRRRVLTPNVAETKLGTRGFHVKDQASQELLETVGASFLAGYGHAVEATSPSAAEERLEEIAVRFRGFAYEGAAMGFTVLDALPVGGSRRLAGFLAGRGSAHIYMVYVGIGWAMARLPKFRWSRLQAPDPLLRWLVLDGYGFHQAYFHTEEYVHRQHQDARLRWPADDPHGYAGHAIDQGIGRAMWFVAGTDAGLTGDLIERFPEERRSDLYAGAGLAATYAGGADAEELRAFADRAGPHRAMVAQGSAFAAKARIRAGLLVPHVELATEVLCGLPAELAAKVCDDVRPDAADGRSYPAYELWRRRIAGELVAAGGLQ